MNELIGCYREWLFQYFGDIGLNYRTLLSLFDSTPFYSVISLDDNRIIDGYNLRLEYAKEHPCNNYEPLFERPVSVLEVMVGLAIRCENIMTNSETDRTSNWLLYMIQSLGLESQLDWTIDLTYCKSVISRFLKREYAPDGCGGLFAIPSTEHDLRKIDIWYQAMWYFSTLRSMGVT